MVEAVVVLSIITLAFLPGVKYDAGLNYVKNNQRMDIGGTDYRMPGDSARRGEIRRNNLGLVISGGSAVCYGRVSRRRLHCDWRYQWIR